MIKTFFSYIKRLLLVTVLYFICLGLGVLLNMLVGHNANMFYAPAFAAVFGGIIYFGRMLSEKSFGFITLTACLLSLFFWRSGHFAGTVIPYILFGLLADVMASWGRYQDRLKNALSFIIFSFTSSGPIFFMWLAPKAYKASLLARGKDQAYIDNVMLEPRVSIILWFIVSILAGSLLGIFLAQKLLIKRNQE
ncbi:MptD family putative ECF transporter S component [Streptococcus dentiloxodontae]